MRTFAATLMAVWGICALAACESAGGQQYDGVSRFAGASTPYYGPGSVPREPHPSPEQPDPGIPAPGPATGNI